MNSSGIKRGLATTAVSALAIAGLPLFASSASAVVTGAAEIKVVSKSGVRQGGDVGGLITLNVKGIYEQVTANGVDDGATEIPLAANFKLGRQSAPGTSPATETGSSTAALVPGSVNVIADGAAGDTVKNDGYDTVTLRVTATTATVGGTAPFAIYYDDDADGYDLGEPLVKDSVTTVGAPTKATLTPATTTAAKDQAVDYTLKLVDANGNPTQTLSTKVVDLTSNPGTVNFSQNQVTAEELASGSFDFTATGTAAVTHTITADPTEAGVANGTATLDIVKAAAIGPAEVDIVTAADSWDGFSATNAFGLGANATKVRVDQSSVTFNIKSTDLAADAGGTRVITVSSANGLLFGGKTSKSYTVTLDSSGVASFVVTPDAGTVANNRSFTIDGFTAAHEVKYEIAAINSVTTDASTYVSAYNGTVSPVVTVKDQFGLPVAGAYVSAQRTTVPGTNPDAAESARKATGADGKVTFDLASTKATALNNGDDTVTFRAYSSEFDDTVDKSTTAVIKYTADGKGADFVLREGAVLLSGAAYDPKTVSAAPLYDANANSALRDEYIALTVSGGTPGAPVTLSADNGAAFLSTAGGASDDLADAKSPFTGKLDGAGNLTVNLVGTKAGLVNVSVTSAGVTKTTQVTIKPSADAKARNVELTGPTAAVGGDTATFTAKITDAFGNGIPGLSSQLLSIQVAGPARLQGTDAQTDSNGNIKINVALDQNANSPVTVSITGLSSGTNEFGANANSTTNAAADAGNAKGLTASKSTATAQIAKVTDIKGLEKAVADAQAALDEAKSNLAAAQGNLDVANTELAVAQANLDTLEAKKAKLKNKLEKADTRKEKRSIRKKLRAVNADIQDAKDAVTIATAKVAAAQGVVDQRQAQVDKAQADLDQAEQNLEDAQNG
jgi:hypothetical protein